MDDYARGWQLGLQWQQPAASVVLDTTAKPAAKVAKLASEALNCELVNSDAASLVVTPDLPPQDTQPDILFETEFKYWSDDHKR